MSVSGRNKLNAIIRNDLDSITKTLELYQEGHYHLDIAKLRQAFHPSAHIVGYDDNGKLMFADLEQYLKILTEYPCPDQSGQPSDFKLIALDITESTTVAKVESLISRILFTSQLSMLRCGDIWQIVNGMFHAQTVYE